MWQGFFMILIMNFLRIALFYIICYDSYDNTTYVDIAKIQPLQAAAYWKSVVKGITLSIYIEWLYTSQFKAIHPIGENGTPEIS